MKDLQLIGIQKDERELAALEDMGYRFGDKGAHTSRTIMLEELTSLLQVCPASSARADYTAAVVERNCLAKHTAATRQLTIQRLGELYGLDPSIPLFRMMRRLWDMDEKGRPLLALLLAMARDPLLRVTAPPILAMQPGQELGRQQITDVLRLNVGERLNESTLDKVVRNTAASWTQSGHLTGRSRKSRVKIQPTLFVVCYAVLLGYLLGRRGTDLFETIWAKVLDSTPDELVFLAMDAKRYGLMDIKQSGGMIAVSFDNALTAAERKVAYGAH
jgi:hypothetical protein